MAKVVSALREVAKRNENISEFSDQLKVSTMTTVLGAVLIASLVAGCFLLIWLAMNMTTR